jgi:hypothetical protein
MRTGLTLVEPQQRRYSDASETEDDAASKRHFLFLKRGWSRANPSLNHFALLEGNLEIIAGQLARLPTRGDLAKTALAIIFCSAVLTTLFVWIAWHSANL